MNTFEKDIYISKDAKDKDNFEKDVYNIDADSADIIGHFTDEQTSDEHEPEKEKVKEEVKKDDDDDEELSDLDKGDEK